jgi:hypothetical protein
VRDATSSLQMQKKWMTIARYPNAACKGKP